MTGGTQQTLPTAGSDQPVGRRRTLGLLAAGIGCGTATGFAFAAEAEDWIWLGNRDLKVGLLRSSGGAIGWLSAAGASRSLVNSFDRGRLVQQSWYGREDGSNWNGRPWRWNPVQGGDWKGRSATILKQSVTESTATIETQPVHWAAGSDITDALMTQQISLQGPLVRIDYRFQYRGEVEHPACHQELPAVFTDPEYSQLAVCTSDRPWTGAPLHYRTPGWPNEYVPMTEHWAALLNRDGQGLGCCVPRASQLTCYRAGQGSAKDGACSYFAPIDTIAVTAGFDMQWTVWLTLGDVTQIRQRFAALQPSPGR